MLDWIKYISAGTSDVKEDSVHYNGFTQLNAVTEVLSIQDPAALMLHPLIARKSSCKCSCLAASSLAASIFVYSQTSMARTPLGL